MNCDQFEKWQKEKHEEDLREGNVDLSIEDFNIVRDMMAMEDNDEEFTPTGDGFGITKSGAVVFSNKDEVNYEKALRKQKYREYRKNKMRIS